MAPLTNLCMSGMAPPGEILLSDSLFDPVYLMLVSVRRKEPLNGIIEHSLLIYSILTNKTSCFSTYKPKLMAFFHVSYYPNFPTSLSVSHGSILLPTILFYFPYYPQFLTSFCLSWRPPWPPLALSPGILFSPLWLAVFSPA